MAKTYNLSSSVGTIQLGENQKLNYKGMQLIGRNSPDWNEPMQQNFVTLADAIAENNVENFDTQINSLLDLYNNDIVYLTQRKMRFTIYSLNNTYPYNIVSAVSFKDINGIHLDLQPTVVSSVTANGSNDAVFYSETIDQEGTNLFLTEKTGNNIVLDFGQDFDQSKVATVEWSCGILSTQFKSDTKLVIEGYDEQTSTWNEIFVSEDVQSPSKIFTAYKFKSQEVVDLMNSIEVRLQTVETDNSNLIAAVEPLPDEINVIKVNQENQSQVIDSLYLELNNAISYTSAYNDRMVALETNADLVSTETITTMQSDIDQLTTKLSETENNNSSTLLLVDNADDISQNIQTNLDILNTSYDRAVIADVVTVENQINSMKTSYNNLLDSNNTNIASINLLEIDLSNLHTEFSNITERQDQTTIAGINAVQNNIDSLVVDTETLRTDYDNLLAESQTIVSNVNSAIAETGTLKNTINNLTTSNIVQLQADIDTIRQGDASIQQSVSTLTTSVNDANSEVLLVQNDIVDLNVRIDAIENDNLTFVLNTQKVIDVETKVNSTKNDLTSLESITGQIKTEEQNISKNISKIDSAQISLNDRLTTLENTQNNAAAAEILALTNQTELLNAEVNLKIGDLDAAVASVTSLSSVVDDSLVSIDESLVLSNQTISDVNEIQIAIDEFNIGFQRADNDYLDMKTAFDGVQSDIDDISVFLNDLYINNTPINSSSTLITGDVTPTQLSNGDTLYKMYQSGSITISDDAIVEILVVGGGGSGAISSGTNYPKGGGGSAVYHNREYALKAGTYDFVIGKGGGRAEASINYGVGNKGGNSTIFEIEVHGGGGGSVYGFNSHENVIGGCPGGTSTTSATSIVKSSMEGFDKKYYKYNNGSYCSNAWIGAGGMGAIDSNINIFENLQYMTSALIHNVGFPGYACNIDPMNDVFGVGGASVNNTTNIQILTPRTQDVGGGSVNLNSTTHTFAELISHYDASGFGNGGGASFTGDNTLGSKGSDGIIIIRVK